MSGQFRYRHFGQVLGEFAVNFPQGWSVKLLAQQGENAGCGIDHQPIEAAAGGFAIDMGRNRLDEQGFLDAVRIMSRLDCVMGRIGALLGMARAVAAKIVRARMRRC